MSKKIIIKTMITLYVIIVCMCTMCYAADGGISKLVGSMKKTSTPEGLDDSFGTVKIVNTAIGLLQIAGSGIALLVITIMGIKYILAAPGEKADIKKMATPIVIGCVLVFGAVNLAAIIESFTGNVLN